MKAGLITYSVQSKHSTSLKSLKDFYFCKIHLFGKYKQVILSQHVICFSALTTPVTKEQYCHMSPIPPLLTSPEQEKKKVSLQDSFTAVQDAHQKTTDVL